MNATATAKLSASNLRLSPDELAEMESTIRVDLTAEGIKQFAHGIETSRRMDKQLAARAGVPPYEEWRKQHIRS